MIYVSISYPVQWIELGSLYIIITNDLLRLMLVIDAGGCGGLLLMRDIFRSTTSHSLAAGHLIIM